ncbi:Protein of unknown function [Gryllus bimaculatus]|nr:Protein of unknown function [Gryllus bimaculatus]
MKILWIVVLVGFLAFTAEAKRKRKFDGDFEFAEEACSCEKIGKWRKTDYNKKRKDNYANKEGNSILKNEIRIIKKEKKYGHCNSRACKLQPNLK